MSAPVVSGIGITQRATPRVQIYRGWDPNNPTTNRSVNAPIATGVNIVSGQVISLQSNNGVYQWILGAVAPALPYIAYQDSLDFDVQASGGLTGLSCLDQIELYTAFFNPTPAGVPYGTNQRLKADGATGNVTTALTTDKPTLGYQTRFDGPVDIAQQVPGVTPNGSGQVLVLVLTTDYQTSGNTA